MRHIIVTVVAVLLVGPCLMAQRNVPDKVTSAEEAKACLREAYRLQYGAKPDLKQAIDLMQKVVDYDPSFEAHYVDESLHMFAMSRLGWAYWDVKDYEKAQESFVLAKSLFGNKHPDRVKTDLDSAIAECRRRLASDSQADTENGAIATVDQAKILLRQAYYADARGTPESRAEATAIARKVAAFDMGLEACFPDERIGLASAYRLAYTYTSGKEYGRAMQAFVVAAEISKRNNPEGQSESQLSYVIADMRQKAIETGQQDWPPMIVSVDGPSLPDGSAMDGCLLTAPAGEIGRLLKLDVRKDNTRGSVTLSTRGSGGKSVALLPGVRDASANGRALGLPYAPRRQGDDLIIPVRAVAEYFGVQVKWDPVARIAWLQ